MSTSTHKNKYLYKGVDSSVMVSKVRSTSPNILVKSDTDQTQGGVYETFCKGIALAWKTRYCRKKESQATQRREIEVLKRLDHRHVVRLVGSYTQGPELGLLIWPVAICDLGAFMDDIDTTRRFPCDVMHHFSNCPEYLPEVITKCTMFYIIF